MRITILLITSILCFSAFCCAGEKIKDNPLEDNELKPYNPEKAGVVIVESFDITDKIAFLETHWLGRAKVKTMYNLAEYNNYIYIRIRKTLYVFDKYSMQKQREIEINIPQEYDFLPYSNPHYSYDSLAVTGNIAFMLFMYHHNPPYKVYLFIVDLDTGKAQYINEETLGIKFIDGHSNIMGYDKQKDVLWFRIVDTGRETVVKGVYYFYFRYDANTNSFTKIDEVVWPYEVNSTKDTKDTRRDAPEASLIATSINGNESWNVYIYPQPRYSEEVFFVVDKRNMDLLTQPVGHINVEYLNTFSLPQSIIYDKPYIWIIIERDERIQMLKLLPNI